MMVIRFRSGEDHEDLMHKVKKMRKFTEELEDLLNDCYDNEMVEYRSGMYRKDYDDEDMRMEGRYGYRRGRR